LPAAFAASLVYFHGSFPITLEVVVAAVADVGRFEASSNSSNISSCCLGVGVF